MSTAFRNTLSLVLTALAPAVVTAQPGTLDASFGVGGFAISPAPGTTDQVEDLAVQADDRIVVVGNTVTASNYDMLLLRFTADGELDDSFGTNGRVTLALGAGNEEANTVVVQPDGRIVVAGYTVVGGVARLALARFLSDGSPDTGFGTNGQTVSVLFSPNANTEAKSILLQPDGKLLVGGTGTVSGQSYFMIARYTANGALDLSFDGGGWSFFDIGFDGEDDVATDIGLQADGKAVLGGYSYTGTEYDFAAMRYNTNGLPDYSGFHSGDGVMTVDLNTSQDRAAATVMLPDGRIVLVGRTSDAFGLVGIAANGYPDAGFGTVVNTVGTSGSYAYAAVLQPWDKVIAAGRCISAGSVVFALARYDAQGGLDAGFGSGGTVVTPVPSYASAEIYALGLQSDGRIVVAGRAGPSSSVSDVVVARYLNDVSTSTSDAAAGSAGFSAYPNPFTDRITIEGTTQGAVITLSDALGREVLRTSATEGLTDHAWPELRPGAYTLSHSTSDGAQRVRVVKQ